MTAIDPNTPRGAAVIVAMARGMAAPGDTVMDAEALAVAMVELIRAGDMTIAVDGGVATPVFADGPGVPLDVSRWCHDFPESR